VENSIKDWIPLLLSDKMHIYTHTHKGKNIGNVFICILFLGSILY